MNCKEFISLQAEYTDGLLDSARAEEVRAHLAKCPACQKRQAAMDSLVQTLHTMDDIPVPAGLSEKVLANLPLPEKKVVRFPRILRLWQTYSAVAACLLVAVTLYAGTFEQYTKTNNESVSYSADISPAPSPVSLAESPSAPEKTSDEIKQSPLTNTKTKTIPVPSAAVPPADVYRNEDTASAPQIPPSYEGMVSETPSTFLPQTEAAEKPPADNTIIPFSAAMTAENSALQSDDAVPAYDGQDNPENAPAVARASGGSAAFARTAPVYVRETLTFIVTDPAGEAIFTSVRAEGPAAVEAAFSAAGIEYTVQQDTEDFTETYHTLTEEAAALSAQIDAGETDLSDRLSEIEAARQRIIEKCTAPVLCLSIL